MTVEILYPCVANLFGEAVEISFLEKCLPEAEFIKTQLNDAPAFLNKKVDMIFMGPTTEKYQEIIAKKLAPYKEKITENIKNGTVFLLTGNAIEVFGKYIEDDDSNKIKTLSVIGTYAKRRMMKRSNSLFLGEFEGMKIVGFKSQFSHSYGENENEGLFKKIKGTGINPESSFEGIRINNFFATYLLGPILILNPDFTKYLFSLLGKNDITLPFEDDITKAYKKRLAEFENDDTVFFG